MGNLKRVSSSFVVLDVLGRFLRNIKVRDDNPAPFPIVRDECGIEANPAGSRTLFYRCNLAAYKAIKPLFLFLEFGSVFCDLLVFYS